jgi:Domain of unknown function (DUF4375)
MKDNLAAQIRQLQSLEPGSRSAEKRRCNLEHGLMQIVLTEGLPGVRRLVRALSVTRKFAPVFAVGSVHAWRCVVDDNMLQLQTNTGRSVKSASISYSKRSHPRSSPGSRAQQAMQQEFYARYGVVGPAGRLASSRLSSADRLVRSIGDLEADLNNGGFAQYLVNKGRSQAARVLRQLRSIGARRTAALLGSALRHPTDSVELGKLDAAYYRRPEDLASVVIQYLRKRLA